MDDSEISDEFNWRIVTGLSMSLFAFFPSMIEVTFQLNARKAGSFMTIMAIGTLIGSKLAGYWTGKKVRIMPLAIV